MNKTMLRKYAKLIVKMGVNIKKGQFLSAEAMRFAMDKVVESGNRKVILTDRGTMFGYQDLIVDFRNIPTMKSFGSPVVMDVTHSLQQPNRAEGVSGGMPQMIETIAKAAIAAGAEVYVTGDIDHHTGIDTVAQGLALIDAGHYGTEYIFMDAVKKELNQAFPELTVSCAGVKSPYAIL